MSTDMTWQTVSTSSAATVHLAEHIGKQLQGGEVIELVSDLGGGKTTFVRGLVRGMGSIDPVASPTFTLNRVYKTDKLELYHFDFYRLSEAGIMAAELAEVLRQPDKVVAIEWGEVVKSILPSQKLTITFIPTAEETRQLNFSYPKELAYLIRDLL